MCCLDQRPTRRQRTFEVPAPTRLLNMLHLLVENLCIYIYIYIEREIQNDSNIYSSTSYSCHIFCCGVQLLSLRPVCSQMEVVFCGMLHALAQATCRAVAGTLMRLICGRPMPRPRSPRLLRPQRASMKNLCIRRTSVMLLVKTSISDEHVACFSLALV